MPSQSNLQKPQQAQTKAQPWKAFIKIEETNVGKSGPTSAEGSELHILAESDDKGLGG
jgi:hypothetical protein